MNRAEVEKILHDELERGRLLYDSEANDFRTAIKGMIPTDANHPDRPAGHLSGNADYGQSGPQRASQAPTPIVVPMTIQMESNRLNRRGSSAAIPVWLLGVEQWIEQYRELKDKNRELLRGGMSARSGDRPPEATNQPKASQSKKRTRR